VKRLVKAIGDHAAEVSVVGREPSVNAALVEVLADDVSFAANDCLGSEGRAQRFLLAWHDWPSEIASEVLQTEDSAFPASDVGELHPEVTAA